VSVLVRNKKLPLNLVKDAFNKSTTQGERLLQIETFQDTFGPTSRRKKCNIGTSDMMEMLSKANENNDGYDATKDKDLHKNDYVVKDEAQHAIFTKG